MPVTGWLVIDEPTIGLTDRSNYLDENNPASFTLQRGSRGTATVTLIIRIGDSYAPTLGAPMYLYEFPQSAAEYCVFAGTIDTVEITWDGDLGTHRAILNCVSLEQCFDVLQCPTTAHFGQTAGFIFQWLLDNIAPDAPVTVGTISAGPVIPIFLIDFDRVSDLFDQLATLAGFIWAVDPADQTIYFKLPPQVVSPFTLDSADVLWETMDWQQTRQDYRNRQTLRIAFGAFFPTYKSFAGDGVTTIFTLPFRIDHLTFTALTTSTQNTGTGTFTGQPSPGDTIQADNEVYTFVTALDNTVLYQVLIGATAADTLDNFIAAINGDPALDKKGVVYSLPTWANAALTADAPSGLVLTVRSGYAGAGSNPLAESCANFTWSGATTAGGVTGASAPLTFVVASADAAASDVYYTVGNENVNCAVAPPAGKNLLVGYYRQGADCISVEDTALVIARAAIEHGTGRYQQISENTEQTDAQGGLSAALANLSAYDALPVTFQFQSDKPGLSVGQNLSILLVSPTGTAALINGTYLIQELNATLIPGVQYIGTGKGHYRYTLHVIDTGVIGTYVEFWTQLTGGGGGGGAGASSGQLTPEAAFQWGGNGNDGAITLDGTATYAAAGITSTGSAPNRIYSLTRDLYATNLTVSAGKTLLPLNFRIFCSGSCTVSGTITNAGSDGSDGGNGFTSAGGGGGLFGVNGSNPTLVPAQVTIPNLMNTTGSVSGAGGAAGVVGAGVNSGGGTSGNTAANSGINRLGITGTTAVGSVGGTGGTASGGSGGVGGAGGSGVAAGDAAISLPYDTISAIRFRAYSGATGTDAQFTVNAGHGGSTGGGSGAGDTVNKGGGGGGGGGNGGTGYPILIIAASITIGAAGLISSKGGNGGNGGNGGDFTGGTAGGGGGGAGGSGGGGGAILLICRALGNAGSITVAGGSAGTGGTGGAGGLANSGTSGGAGTAGRDGVSITVFV